MDLAPRVIVPSSPRDRSPLRPLHNVIIVRVQPIQVGSHQTGGDSGRSLPPRGQLSERQVRLVGGERRPRGVNERLSAGGPDLRGHREYPREARDIRSASGPSSSTATPMSCAANSSKRARPSASRCDMSTSASPSRRVTVMGWSSASANTSAECLLRSEERRVKARRAVVAVPP